MNTSDAPSTGLTLNGYQLIRLLGEGGAGSVFKASQTSTGQIVALKLLHQGGNAEAGKRKRLIKRFERETRLCAQLHHPHIVRLLDKGQTESQQLYAVFEFVPGETLKEMLIRKGRLSALTAGELLGQVLDALACAHAQGIAHRDLKPQNIMVTATGTRLHVKVLDFGIATVIPERQKADYRSLTITQETMCSPSYSAPEQLRGEPPTVKSDLYAWGLLFIECLTGKPAIHGQTLAEVFHKQLSMIEVPIPPGLAGHPLASLLRRVLHKNPRERAEHATALYQDFQRINLANIAGDLYADLTQADDHAPVHHEMSSLTQEHQPGWYELSYARQQISVLSCSLFARAHAESETEIEALEAVQRDQLSLCVDIATRYGGHLAGSIGNSLMFYYGYPHVTDNDARRAMRTALELISQVRRRSPLLEQQQGIRLDIRIGIHTGIVLARPDYLPAGITPNTAMQLEHLASPGTVLVSATSRRLLDQYVQFEDTGGDAIKDNGEALRYFSLAGEYSAEALSFIRSSASGDALIGRRQEIDTLSIAWNSARQRRGRAVLMQGEAGIGKSRIAYELCMMVRKEGYLTRECRCLPEHRHHALYPILEMLRTHLQLQEENNAEKAVARLTAVLKNSDSPIEWILPILCSWLALPIPECYPLIQFSPHRQKKILLTALKNLILQIGIERPFLWVIEDIHWIDQISFELLSQVAQAISSHKVMMLMIARPDFSLTFDSAHVEPISIGPLAEADAKQLVGKIITNRPINPASLHRLCERTDGVPLFIEELTRMLLDNNLLTERHGVLQLDEDFDTSDIPVTLRDLLNARLTGMGSARETAQLAAAIGREFDYALLVNVSLADEGTLQSDLDQLIAAGLIYRHRRVHGDSYIFRHSLIRDAAYDMLPRLARERTHARIARHLERGSPTQTERNPCQLIRHASPTAEFPGATALSH